VPRLNAARKAHAALLRATGRVQVGVDRELHTLWSEVLAVLRSPAGFYADQVRLSAVLRRVGAVTADALRRRLVPLYRSSHAAAADALAPRLRRRLREDELSAMLLPPPPEEMILRWLEQFVRPEAFGLIGTDFDKRMPETVAAQIASSLAAGKTGYQAAKDLRPHFEGSRVRAARASRTFGLLVGQQAQRDAWQASGLVVGYELIKTVVPDSRPWHVARIGRRYYFNPGPGQDGMSKCPHPPLEPDDPSERPPGTPRIAWNCLCALVPILGE